MLSFGAPTGDQKWQNRREKSQQSRRIRQSFEQAINTGNTIKVEGKGNITGIAGRDFIVNEEAKARVDELIAILGDRAARIETELAGQYQSDVQRCLTEFRTLHKEHIAALRDGQLIRAHEILQRINCLSYSLETSESARTIRPGEDYAMLGSDHYSRGALMCGYIAGDCRRKSDLYTGQQELDWVDPHHPRMSGGFEEQVSRYARLFSQHTSSSNARCPKCYVALGRLELDSSNVHALMPFIHFGRDGQGIQCARCPKCAAAFATQHPSGKVIAENWITLNHISECHPTKRLSNQKARIARFLVAHLGRYASVGRVGAIIEIK